MDITQKDNGEIKIISIKGNLDTTTAPDAEKEILAVLENGFTKLIINLEQTQYVSSSGLRVMLSTAKKLKGIGELRISNLNDIVEEVFDISGFSTILNVDKTEEESLVKLSI